MAFLTDSAPLFVKQLVARCSRGVDGIASLFIHNLCSVCIDQSLSLHLPSHSMFVRLFIDVFVICNAFLHCLCLFFMEKRKWKFSLWLSAFGTFYFMFLVHTHTHTHTHTHMRTRTNTHRTSWISIPVTWRSTRPWCLPMPRAIAGFSLLSPPALTTSPPHPMPSSRKQYAHTHKHILVPLCLFRHVCLMCFWMIIFLNKREKAGFYLTLPSPPSYPRTTNSSSVFTRPAIQFREMLSLRNTWAKGGVSPGARRTTRKRWVNEWVGVSCVLSSLGWLLSFSSNPNFPSAGGTGLQSPPSGTEKEKTAQADQRTWIVLSEVAVRQVSHPFFDTE